MIRGAGSRNRTERTEQNGNTDNNRRCNPLCPCGPLPLRPDEGKTDRQTDKAAKHDGTDVLVPLRRILVWPVATARSPTWWWRRRQRGVANTAVTAGNFRHVHCRRFIFIREDDLPGPQLDRTPNWPFFYPPAQALSTRRFPFVYRSETPIPCVVVLISWAREVEQDLG